MKHQESILTGVKKLKIKAEKPRSQAGMVVGILLTLGLLGIVSYVALKPRVNVYTLRSYETVAVRVGTLIETTTLVGTVISAEERSLSTASAGQWMALDVEIGDTVTQGQVLARMRSKSLDTDLLSVQSDLLDATTQAEKSQQETQNAVLDAQQTLQDNRQIWEDAKQGLKLTRELYGAGAVAKLDFLKSQNAVQVARRKLDMAEQKLNAARMSLLAQRNTYIRKMDVLRRKKNELDKLQEALVFRAPVSGRVTGVAAKPGENVQANVVVFKVASVKNLLITAKLDESQAEQVKAGQPVAITINNRRYSGKVSKVSQDTQMGDKGTFVPAEIRFETLPVDVKLGASATLEITTDTLRNVLTLPRAEYLTSGGERLVYVLHDETAERKEVSFGAQNSDHVEVVSGLKEGDKIIASSYEAFKDQAEIRVPLGGELGLERP